MKKFLIFTCTLILFGCSVKDNDEIAKKMNYYFSEDDATCAYIFYDVPGAPPLKIEDQTIHHYFDERNILATSSPSDFGWKSEESTVYKASYFKSDGSKVENEDDIFFGNGGQTVDGVEYSYQSFKLKDTDGKDACPSIDSSEDNPSLPSLIKEIYKIDNN